MEELLGSEAPDSKLLSVHAPIGAIGQVLFRLGFREESLVFKVNFELRGS
jgi:hypothetical protein